MVCRTNARTVAAADFGSRPSDRINVPSSLLEGVQPSLVRVSHIVGHSFFPIYGLAVRPRGKTIKSVLGLGLVSDLTCSLEKLAWPWLAC